MDMGRSERYCRLLRKTVTDSRKAVAAYRKLSRMAPTGLARDAHLRQCMQEMVEYKVNKLLYRRYCAR